MTQNSKSVNTLIVTYLTLRKVIGALGISLPFIVSIGAFVIFGNGLQSSISAYYHTGMRDVFVGILFAIGFFLLSYTGYDKRDNITGNLACIFAVGVALFPTAPEGKLSSAVELIGTVHLIFASLFFLTLTYFSYFLFTITDPTETPTPQKLKRNVVYRVCGVVMFICILLIAIFHFLPNDTKVLFQKLNPIYWLEALAIVAFGVSWFVKGETIFKD